MDEQEVVNKLKTKPEWIVETEDGNYEITLKGKKYIMAEQSGETIERCEIMSKKTNTSMESLLARQSLINPKLTDEEFSKLPGGVYAKLKFATVYIYGLNDFL